MNQAPDQSWPWTTLPGQRRFETDFPLAVWFAGLWFFLKGFLYVCYVYMIGLEPSPYSVGARAEIAYFVLAFIPALALGAALWNEKGMVQAALLFLIVDTPFMIFHVFRLAEAGSLDSGLTMLLEYGSLGLNFLSLGWLAYYWAEQRLGHHE